MRCAAATAAEQLDLADAGGLLVRTIVNRPVGGRIHEGRGFQSSRFPNKHTRWWFVSLISVQSE
jgi:hypothetical protein